jgi:hypothetical protein
VRRLVMANARELADTRLGLVESKQARPIRVSSSHLFLSSLTKGRPVHVARLNAVSSEP